MPLIVQPKDLLTREQTEVRNMAKEETLARCAMANVPSFEAWVAAIDKVEQKKKQRKDQESFPAAFQR